MGVVSRTPNLKQIQGELADMLGLKFHEESDSGRAHRLYARLKNEKKILIILDDVWAILDLDSIGIPFGVDHKACRILVTTQNECVCSTMGAQTRKIPLNVLSEGDSWALFRRISGEVVDSPRFNAVARDVVEECGGFPLMLVKIGRSLRGKTLEEWKDLCRQLKKSRALNKEEVDKDTLLDEYN
jgi:disease resistance protein RPS2|uniref:NB-ARC domain-containing protein n=1 Tax=Fagus sylvatica TaxID=28930 RepID=A0A2N9H6K6_FAGSY